MAHDLDQETTKISTSPNNFGDNKLDKSGELNESMTIAPSGKDEYTRTIHNVKGGNTSE